LRGCAVGGARRVRHSVRLTCARVRGWSHCLRALAQVTAKCRTVRFLARVSCTCVILHIGHHILRSCR
jgi:hypothetical protein